MAKDKAVFQDTVLDCEISDVLHNSMMPYSEYVILDRALPRVEDGLKPVQRRILYTMYELGTTPDKPYRKSARIVGDCLGKYHPHGDTSVYGAMVRMAQSFNMSSMLVDGHGNFGSIDGDSAAAMRYTEVRLQPLALEMLRDIEQDTVDWMLNFDDTLKEPRTLPGRFPNLLVNGASGIAVGLATNIPPHNITEVIDGVCAYIENPKISLDNLMEYIKAPDFPSGGELLVNEDLKRAYETGRGKIAIRAKVMIEKDGDKLSFVITELPYQVNKAALLAKIDEYRETKKEIFGDITDIIDASDRTGMRAIIKFKRDCNHKKLLHNLFQYTDLQQNFNINMVAIADGKPQQLGLLDLVRYYVNYQQNLILRRSQYQLANAKAREHILQGIIIAIENIDEVIKIIKSSASPAECKAKLKERFLISEKQAQAILEIKLARLTKLEVDNLREEIAELLKTIDYLTGVVGSKRKQLSIVKAELLDIRKRYKLDRRSHIFVDGIEQKIQVYDVNEIEEKKGYCILTNQNCIKFLTSKTYKGANKTSQNCSSEDIPSSIVACSNLSPVYAFTNMGNVAQINIDDLKEEKWRSKGAPAAKVIGDLAKGEVVIKLMTKEQIENKNLLFVMRSGMVKVGRGEEYLINKKFYQATSIKEDDRVVYVDTKDDSKTIITISHEGVALNMESEITPTGRKSQGVIGMSLSDGDYVEFAEQIDDEGEIIIVTDKGCAKKVIAGLIKVSGRNRKGNKIQSFTDKTGYSILFAGYVKEPYDLILVGENGDIVPINSEEIRIENMNSRGTMIPNIAGNIAKILPLKVI